jgi:hypothetical protein
MEAPMPKKYISIQTYKVVSALLIIAYLILPAICYGQPCEVLQSNSLQCTAASDHSGACPLNQVTDNCESTCCCAGHILSGTLTKILYGDLASRLLPYEPDLVLPQLIDRIFVPPQNHS